MVLYLVHFFFFNDTATTEIYTLSLHDALPIYLGQPDRQHPAEPAVHLAGRELVTRMRRQPRVEHARQRRMALEAGGDRQRALGGAVHPQEQGAHAPLQQPRLERPQRGAGVAPPGPDPRPERIAAGGQHRPGVATVLSTATRATAEWASSQTAARSVISHIGFAGVSTQMGRVRPGRIAASTAARSQVSVNSTSRPQVRPNSASHLRTPQYSTRETST